MKPSVRAFATLSLLLPALVWAPAAGAAAAADSIRFATSVIDVNRVGLTLTNYGFLGNNFVSRSPSLEYPLGTGYEHLVRGGLWIGARAEDDAGPFTGVTTAAFDGTQGTSSASETEFTPAGLGIRVRSSLMSSGSYDPDAVSERDCLADFSDRPAKRVGSYPEPHRPLDVLVRQENYGWSFAPYADIVFAHYTITNLGDHALNDPWVGVYSEFASGPKNAYSTWPPSSSGSTLGGWFNKKLLAYDESLRLFREHYCASQPVPDACHFEVTPAWAGVKLLTAPGAGQHVTFAAWNWNSGSPARDQDVEKYAVLSAGTIVPTGGDSLLPGTGDPVELLAIGPFPAIAPGDSIHVDFALLGGGEVADIQEHARAAQQLYDAGYAISGTGVLVSVVRSAAGADGVDVAWRCPTIAGADVMRRDPVATWRRLGAADARGDGVLAYQDREVVAGGSYAYALRIAGGRILGETAVTVPVAHPALAIQLASQPSFAGAIEASLVAAADAPVTIELLDVAGRVVERQVCAHPRFGGTRVVLGAARPLPSAMYLLRATQGQQVATARACVIR